MIVGSRVDADTSSAGARGPSHFAERLNQTTTTMKKLSLALFGVALLVATTAATFETAPHFGLKTSAPEAGASVTAPDEVRLWFTQEPQEGTVQIRIMNAAEEAIEVGDVMVDPDDGTSFAVAVDGAMPAGAYTVAWRGMGQDGHVIRDTFEFSVTAQ